MQQKEQNISPVKQRILKFVDDLGISHREFYLKTGVSRGTLTNKSGISEDTLSKIFAIYPILNDGKIAPISAGNIAGKMAGIIEEPLESYERFPSDGNPACLNCKRLEQDIFFLQDVIKVNNLSLARYDRENAELRAENAKLKGNSGYSNKQQRSA